MSSFPYHFLLHPLRQLRAVASEKGCRQISTRFRAHQGGNVALITALSMFVILGGVGTAIDFMQMNNARSEMQNAIDSGVLAAGAKSGGTTQSREALGLDVANDNIINIKLKDTPEISIKIDPSGVRGTMSAQYQPIFMHMFGFNNLPISVEAEASVTTPNAEIVMVLDYSSSMNSKYVAMRNAAIELINTITANGQESGIDIGLVPFAEEAYLRVDGRYIVGGSAGHLWQGCTMSRKWPFVITDRSPTANANSQWGANGSDCHEYPSRGLIARPLGNSHAQTIAQLSMMRPHSGTNTTVGMEIGYQMISPNLPFDASPYINGKRKFLILLSDGQQTRSSYGPGGAFTSKQAEQNLQSLCKAAANNGVVVITILYGTNNNKARQAMQSCASAPENFLVGNASSIGETFRTIAGLISSDLRLSM
jgi:Flp pilus assembly protein TadG